MNTTIKRGTALAALTGAALLAAPGTAQAADCGQEAQEATFKTVTTPGTAAEYTTVTVIDQPAVDGIEPVWEDVLVIDQEYVPATPGTPAVEEVSHIEHRLVTPEVPATPAIPAVYEDVKVIDVEAQPAVPGTPEIPEVSHIEQVLVSEGYDKTVVDKEAYTEVIKGKWWVWAPNNSQGPQDYTPDFPTDSRGTWIGPKTEGGPDGEGTFNVSHGNSGNSSWFHRDADQTIEHPAETHVEHVDAVYRDEKVIDQPYVPATPGTPAVEEVSHIEHRLVTPEVPATPGSPAVYEDVKVIDVEAKPAVPGTPEIPEISHVETVLVSPGSPGSPATYKDVKVLVHAATPATSTKVQVTKAVEATEDCAVPSSQRRQGLLAFTGSDTAPLAGLGFGLLVLGGAATAVARGRRNEG